MLSRDFNFHLGDNANFGGFSDSTYIGMETILPVIIGSGSPDSKLIFHTTDIETLAEWQAHTVHLDSYLLGYIRDTSGNASELHEFAIPVELADGAMRKLSVRVVGKGPGLEDDFVLRKIEWVDVDLKFGWA